MTTPSSLDPPPASSPAALLFQWLGERLSGAEAEWLAGARRTLSSGCPDREFLFALALVARRVPDRPLEPTATEAVTADATRPGWRPQGWRLRTAARTALLLASAEEQPDRLGPRLDTLMATADLAETVSILEGLPLLPDPARHLGHARAGARSNMRPVFEAVAHRNPYPAERFDEETWNQMVLKALFIESPLAPVAGLRERGNPRLARMLLDYAAERRAAGRPVPEDLSRLSETFHASGVAPC